MGRFADAGPIEPAPFISCTALPALLDGYKLGGRTLLVGVICLDNLRLSVGELGTFLEVLGWICGIEGH